VSERPTATTEPATPAARDSSAPADRTPAPTGRLDRLPTWTLGLGLVLLHLAVTFQVRPHPRWNDGIFVLNDARDFPDVPLDHHALRIGNLLPVRAFLELFGYGQWSYYAWPFLMGIALVVAVFALGTVLFGRWVSAAGTVLLVFHPVLVDTVIKVGTERMTSWQLLPDIPSTALVAGGLALLIGAAQKTRDGGPSGSGAPSWWFYAAGLCLGWSYLVRELSVFLFPLALFVLLAWRLPLRRWVQTAIPMLGCLVLEMVLAQWAHGDPLARLKVDAGHGSAPLAPITRLDAVLRFPRVVENYPQTVVVLATLVLMVLGALLVRRRGNVLMLAWFVTMWLPLTLVSGLIDPGFIRINASLMRYWVPILPALCLGAAAAVAAVVTTVRSWLPARLQGAGIALAAAVTVLALAVAVVPLLPRIADNPRDAAWNTMRSYLAEHDDEIDTIVTDDRDALVLGIYAREPLGGELVFHADVVKTGHNLKAPPASNGEEGTYLLWTPGLSRTKPTRVQGWELVLKQPQLRLYAPLS
jgi:hypothetical protein